MSDMHRDTPSPTEIKLHSVSKRMEISFSDGAHFLLPFEFLRVYSPSAEVRGHGHGQETLQLGKQNVKIVHVEQVGTYAIQPTFSDGHATGIYSWEYLYELGVRQDQLWDEYLLRVKNAPPVQSAPKTGAGGCGGGGGCGHHH